MVIWLSTVDRVTAVSAVCCVISDSELSSDGACTLPFPLSFGITVTISSLLFSGILVISIFEKISGGNVICIGGGAFKEAGEGVISRGIFAVLVECARFCLSVV